MVWLAVTRPDMPRRMVSAAITSTNLECSSSVSSQWMSTCEPVLVGEREHELDRLDAVLAGQLVVRDPADDVGAQLNGLAHQLPAAVEAQDALLREGDELQVDQAAYLLAQLDEGPQRAQLRIAHIDVAADMLDAAGQLPAQDLPDPRLHVLAGQAGHPLGPHRDALEQRAGHVRPRLTDG